MFGSCRVGDPELKLALAAMAAGDEAIEEFMQEAPFAGRIPAFLGDDHTDEDGFGFVNAHDGWSVHIGAGPTNARRTLPDPLAVWRALRALHPPKRGHQAAQLVEILLLHNAQRVLVAQHEGQVCRGRGMTTGDARKRMGRWCRRRRAAATGGLEKLLREGVPAPCVPMRGRRSERQPSCQQLKTGGSCSLSAISPTSSAELPARSTKASHL